MKVLIEVECDNAAFEGGRLYSELKRILITAAEKAVQQERRKPCLRGAAQIPDTLLDINGNTVGTVRLEK